MDGIGGGQCLIGIGHDLQQITEFKNKLFLKQPGFFFTKDEHDYAFGKNERNLTEAGMFCAKESFYKSLQERIVFFWTDLEIKHCDSGKPYFNYHGMLKEYMEKSALKAFVSITHSGNYASAVVFILKDINVFKPT